MRLWKPLEQVCTDVYTHLMDKLGIRELRNDLSNQVKRASRGESVVVTVDGEPTAMLVPLGLSDAERTRDELVASGRVIPAKRRGERPPPPPRRFKGRRPSKEILDEIRADRL